MHVSLSDARDAGRSAPAQAGAPLPLLLVRSRLLLALPALALALLASAPAHAQEEDEPQPAPSTTPAPAPVPGAPGRPTVRPIIQRPGKFRSGAAGDPADAGDAGEAPPGTRRPPFFKKPPSPTQNAPTGPVSKPVNRPAIAPTPSKPTAVSAQPTRDSPPPDGTPVDKKEAGKNSKTVQMNFDKRDLAEVIQFVANFTQRNFILPERVSGKITILSNKPIPAEEVWNVFVAALDANNWAVYPVGHYWKLSEKKQSARANIPTFLEPGQATPASEQMVTKLFKLHYVEADQMRNTLNQFTSRDSDFQIFPPETLIISDLGLNMLRLERLIQQLDQPGGSEEIHIVQVQYAGAQELAQKLTEIFTAQQAKTPGGQRQLGIAEPTVPGQPIVPQGLIQPGAPAQGGGPVQVSKIIAEERTNKLIVIAGGKSFTRVVELIKQLDVPASEGGVHVKYLENAKAEELAATLQSLAQGAAAGRAGGGARRTGNPPGVPAPPGGATPAGTGGPVSADLFSGDVKITADKNTNSLVITGSASDYRNVLKVVEQLDIRRRQVFVEAVIMEINLQNETDFGVSMHGGSIINNLNFRGAQGSAPVVVGSELGGLSSLGGVSSLASLGGFLAGIQGPSITVPGTSISLPSFGVLLNALQSSSDVNVISTPTVIMTDNSEGEITVGQNVPFQAGFNPGAGLSGLASGATGATAGTAGIGSLLGLGGGLGSLYAPIQRQNVELRLRIKPQINESDYVRLEVDEQTEEIASIDKQLGPTTSKRTAKTTVVAKDQETVVLGGLIQERTLKSVQKLPLLGSLPVIGWLFRNEQTKKTKTNLLLFLTPYIIRDQSDYRRIFERKMAERAEFVKRFTGEDARYEATIDYSRKAGPLSRVNRSIDQEMSKAENGGTGSVSERLIAPAPRYTPPQLDQQTAKPIPGAPATPKAPAKEAPGIPMPAPVQPIQPNPEPPPSEGNERQDAPNVEPPAEPPPQDQAPQQPPQEAPQPQQPPPQQGADPYAPPKR